VGTLCLPAYVISDGTELNETLMSTVPVIDRTKLDTLLPELAVFCRVVQAGGFSAAADLCDVPVSTVSRALARLETALGVRLLNRTTRQVAVTDDGKDLYARCATHLHAIGDALMSTRDSKATPGGTLRISSAATFGRRHIAPLVGEFMNRYPDISVELFLDDRIADPIADGVDICICGGRPEATGYIVRPLAPMPMYVCASPHYLKSRPILQAPEEIAAHRCVRFRSRGTGKVQRWEFRRDGEFLALDAPGNLLLDDEELVCHSVLNGAGLGQLPGYIAIPEIRAGKLVPVMLDYLDESRYFYLQYVNREQRQPLRISLFIRFVLEAISGDRSFRLDAEEWIQLAAAA
jgi:DNA-binding transcriptional LysR family regulator